MWKASNLILLFLFFKGSIIYAQSLDSTIVLNELSVVAIKDKYLTGSKIQTIDSTMIRFTSGKSITDLINIALPLYIKQDAGGLASIRIRGTSPNHTAVLFNGININSQTLGNSNISDLPVFLFDEVRVQFGSSSSLYGSDAIGGSLQLNNNIDWNKGLNIGLQQDIGSFNSLFSGIKTGYSNNSFNYSIKVYKQFSDNDFPFLNTAVKDIDNNSFVKDKMRNAAISNIGFLQNLYFKISNNLFFHSNLWYDENWHQIQPNMSTNYYGGTFEEIKNKHTRIVVGLKYYNHSHRLTTDFGFVNDYQLYQKNYEQTISNQTFTINSNYYNSTFFKGNLNAGLSYKFLKPKVYAYNEKINESRVDLFVLYIKPLFNNISIILNAREAMVTDYNSQFAPALGFNYQNINRGNEDLNFKLSVSKSFKTPTFNDRFWYPNGNPNLLTEKSLCYEFNSSYVFKENSWGYKSNISLYYMTINNLIQWVNRDIWRPENIKKTRNRGIEFSIELSKLFLTTRVSSGLNYSYTKATETDNYDPNSSSLGKQLMYTPKHLGNFFLMFSYKQWDIMTITNYTGERFTESYKLLKYYMLLNASLEKQIKYKGHHFALSIKINNILNKSYQNQYLFAMPGINFNLSFKYSISNLKH